MSTKRLKEMVSMSARVGMNESEDKKIVVPVIWRRGRDNLLTVTERYALIVSENAGPDLMLYAAGRFIARKAAGELKRSYVNVDESYVVPGIDSVLIMLKAGGLEKRAYELELLEEYEDSDGVLWVLEAKEISLDEFMRRHEHRVEGGGAPGERSGAQAGEGFGGAEDVRGGRLKARPLARSSYGLAHSLPMRVDVALNTVWTAVETPEGLILADGTKRLDTLLKAATSPKKARREALMREMERREVKMLGIQGGEGDGLEAGEGYERDSDSDEMGEG